MNPWDLSCRSSSSQQRAPTLAFGRPPSEHQQPQLQQQHQPQRKHHFHLDAPTPQPPPAPRLAYLSYQPQPPQLAAHALTSIHQLVAAPPAVGSPPSFCSLASSPNSTRSNSIEASSCCDDLRVSAKARPLATGADLIMAHPTWTAATPTIEKTMTITHSSNETAAVQPPPPPPLSPTTTTAAAAARTLQSPTDQAATTRPAAAPTTTTMTMTTSATTTTTLGLDKKARKKDQNRRAAYNYRRKKMEERNRIREEEMRLVYSRVCLIGYVEELESSIMYILNTKTRRILDKNGNTNCFLCPICLQSCDNTLNLRSHLNLLHNQLDSH